MRFKLKKDLSNLDSFDFWKSFVDIKEMKDIKEGEVPEKFIRKTSFMTLNSEN